MNDRKFTIYGYGFVLSALAATILTSGLFSSDLRYFLNRETKDDFVGEYVYFCIFAFTFYSYILSWLEILVFLHAIGECFNGINQFLT